MPDKEESWLTRNIRPLAAAALTLTAVVGTLLPFVTVPDQLWNLLQIVLGGYVVSRGGEKVMKTWKNSKEV